jgi:formylglycine-generating enzyme required for sulfatase activity
MDRGEVTNAMFWAYDPSHESAVKNDSGYPVNSVTWEQAAQYCNWRSAMEGLEPCYTDVSFRCDQEKNGYRLPTESEWEYAARGGLVGKRYPWGDTLVPAVNCQGYGPGTTWESGRYSMNNFGLFDMAGNVAEWCDDWYDKNWYSNYVPSQLQKGPPSGILLKVVRGGGYNSSVQDVRASARDSKGIDITYSGIGFRCVRNMD